MIKLFNDKSGIHEIKEIDFGEAFPNERREFKFYVIADSKMRDLLIELRDADNQISITKIPEIMDKNQIWEGTLTWVAGENPPIKNPFLIIKGTEVLGWGI
jgi:hypothetical protein